MKHEQIDRKILKILLKTPLEKKTITSLAKETGLSRVGIWKALKKLEKDKLIITETIGVGKTNSSIINLNWNNILVEKILALALVEEALKQERWLNNFSELENKVDFLIIYGSILSSSKKAGDIDITIISNKKKFKEIDKNILKIQKTQFKKIHAIIFTQEEFKQEIKKQNKAFIDAIKKGVVLFGQDNYIRFIKNL